MNSFIDLRNLKIESRDDLLKYCNTFRNPSFENFRIIYMKDNKSLGYETIVSRIPNTLNRFIIKSKFPYLKDNNLFEEYIYEVLQNGFWNEYLGKEKVFIFKFNSGNIKKYVLNKQNEKEILQLCEKFASCEFESIDKMLKDNSFYAQNYYKKY